MAPALSLHHGEQILWLAFRATWHRDACSPRREDAVGGVGAAAPRRGRARASRGRARSASGGGGPDPGVVGLRTERGQIPLTH